MGEHQLLVAILLATIFNVVLAENVGTLEEQAATEQVNDWFSRHRGVRYAVKHRARFKESSGNTDRLSVHADPST